MIRVLIADDDPLVRVGLSMLLVADGDIEVVGEAADGAEALVEAERTRPDVVLMDIRMPGMDGLAAIERLASTGRDPAVIVLTTFDTDEYVLRALRAGANGFLLKDTPPRQIIDLVRRVAGGESALSPSVLARLIDHFVRDQDHGGRRSRADDVRSALAELTDQERSIAFAIGEGRSNAEIGAELYMSVATVKANVSRILAKLNCANRIQIAILVHESRD